MTIDHWRGLLGVFVILAIAWALSENRKIIPWRLGAAAMGLQVALLAFITFMPGAHQTLSGVDKALDALTAATYEGLRFTFGYLAGGPQPFEVTNSNNLFILAIQVLPLMIVISALSAVLWRWRVLEFLCRGFGAVFERTLGIGGPVSLATAANIFLGMIESPLTIRPHLPTLTRSEMFIVMTTGMATVAGTVMAIYAVLLRPTLPDAAMHILVASFMAAPASVFVARLMIPELPGAKQTSGESARVHYNSTIEAFAQGADEGMKVFLSVIAMLIASTALVALLNSMLGIFPDVFGGPISIERLCGWVLAPLAWIMGVPWHEAEKAGGLMGIKATLNELIAYIRLSEIPAGEMTDRTRLILTYALCGFANFSGAAIMVGGLSSVCPERRSEIGELGLKSILSGILTTSMTAALAGSIYGVFN